MRPFAIRIRLRLRFLTTVRSPMNVTALWSAQTPPNIATMSAPGSNRNACRQAVRFLAVHADARQIVIAPSGKHASTVNVLRCSVSEKPASTPTIPLRHATKDLPSTTGVETMPTALWVAAAEKSVQPNLASQVPVS